MIIIQKNEREQNKQTVIKNLTIFVSYCIFKNSLTISRVLNEQGTGYEHIFSSVQTFNIDWIEKWGKSSERASKH